MHILKGGRSAGMKKPAYGEVGIRIGWMLFRIFGIQPSLIFDVSCVLSDRFPNATDVLVRANSASIRDTQIHLHDGNLKGNLVLIGPFSLSERE